MTTLFRYLPTLLLFLLLASCEHSDHQALISGDIQNIRQAELYLYADDSPHTAIDTIHVKNGSFEHRYELTQPRTLTLLFPNFFELPIVVSPGDDINLKADATHLAQAHVKGSPDNEALTAFRHAILDKSPREQTLAAQQFIYDHVSSPAAVAVFRRHYASAQHPDPSEALTLLDTLMAAQPTSDDLRRLHTLVAARLLCAEGQPLPDFEEVSIAGDTITRDAFKGSNLIIALWGAWQRDARNFVRNIRRLEELSKDRNVKFLLVAFDPSRQSVQRLLRTDTLHSPILCDQQSFASPLVATFGLRQLPEFIHVSPEGIIQQRELSFGDVEEAIKKIK